MPALELALERIHPLQRLGAWTPVRALLPRAARNANAELLVLQDELQATRLEMWDPELSAQLLRLLLWARQKALPPTQMNPEEHQRSRELLKRLARLDAAAALDYARPAQG